MLKTQGLVVRTRSAKTLAGCGPSEERNETLPVMDFPARNERHATQHEQKKQRRKLQSSQLVLRLLLQEILHPWELSTADCGLPIDAWVSPKQSAIGSWQSAMPSIRFLANERGNVEIIDARVCHHWAR